MAEPHGPIPDALVTAHRELNTELEKAIKQCSESGCFSNAREIRQRMRYFIDEFYLIDGGKAELLRRATLVRKLCGKGSDYDKAHAQFLLRFQGQPLPVTPATPTIEKLKYSAPKPRLLDNIDQGEQAIERLLSQFGPGLSAGQRQAAEAWRIACRAVQREAAPFNIDGCRFLMHCSKAYPESSSGEFILPWIKDAAKSLVDWANANRASQIPDPATSTPNSSKAAGGDAATAADTSNKPKQYLMNWHEILGALELNHNSENRQRVARLNKSKKHPGPIISTGQGGQPKVEKTRLMAWWESLENQFAQSKSREDDTAASAANQHPHGREGQVAPDLAGSVKPRRRNRT
jgi:hypothetical protein